jgi:hypothetical protein
MQGTGARKRACGRSDPWNLQKRARKAPCQLLTGHVRCSPWALACVCVGVQTSVARAEACRGVQTSAADPACRGACGITVNTLRSQ